MKPTSLGTSAAPPQRRESEHGDLLHAHREEAALLLDETGTVRAATPKAAELLDRSLEELQGLCFGIVPPHPLRVQLDLISRAGRRVINAQSAYAEEDAGYRVVLLDDSSRSMLVSDAAALALFDVAVMLRSRRITARVCEWPCAEASPSLRPLLAEAITCLVDLTSPSGGVLRVGSRLAGGDYIVISLETIGSKVRELEDFTARFALSLRRAETAGGTLTLEMSASGPSLQLILPLV